MKKSKKSSRGRSHTGKTKNKKPVVIFIYGPVAAGKLTIARILSKKLGYKLTHNHLINDFVEEVFPRGTYTNHYMKDFLRYFLFENMVKANMNFIMTHAYGHNFVSDTGLSDPKYVQTLERKLTNLGAKFYPIHLQANEAELMKRVSSPSRKTFKKLRNKKIMRKLLTDYDHQTSPKLKQNLVIDNTNIPPAKVSAIIIRHFKLHAIKSKKNR